ncbi:hypothetical protein AAFC00_003258 [Neodothiora populina]|uniref:Oxidoreductase n=1 Tax=Neodothiora populina TaxID=2781224 RepID=A0ABR3P9T9_9PEZI
MAPLGIAVIGSGLFVAESHIPAIEANSELVTLKALYSRSLSSAKSLLSDIPKTLTKDNEITIYTDDSATPSYKDLLARDDISGVVIALPIPAQPTYIKQALEAGKHVLSEKPIAKDLADAQELLSWYESKRAASSSFPTWGVAENWRHLPRFHYGASQIAIPESLGRILTFRARVQLLVKDDGSNKYFLTSWRKTPSYQGGFLLDGGVHFLAGVRVLLAGGKTKVSRVSAFTSLSRQWLPPIDTLNGTVKCTNGAVGTVDISFGASGPRASEFVVVCENGIVDVGFDRTTIKFQDGRVEEKSFENDGNGVKAEIKVWSEAIGATGGVKEADVLKPQEALADLEFLEAMIKSGEADGAPQDLKLQI